MKIFLTISRIKNILYKFLHIKEGIKMHVSNKEKKLFSKYIKNAKYYLEFGCGGSTLKVLQTTQAQIFAVESDPKWIQYLNSSKKIKEEKNKKRLFFHHGNIGKIKEWGCPINEDSKNLFPNYSADIFNHLEPEKIDTIFIDGRFRVACTLMSILKISPLNNSKDIIILIHDFWNRKQYHIVLKYLDEIDRADTLGVFKIKKDIDLNEVKKDYEVYKYNLI